jgi:hypothetical protein
MLDFASASSASVNPWVIARRNSLSMIGTTSCQRSSAAVTLMEPSSMALKRASREAEPSATGESFSLEIRSNRRSMIACAISSGMRSARVALVSGFVS